MRFSFSEFLSLRADACLDRDRCAGRISRASTREPSNTTITTMGILRMTFPMVPEPRSSGQKATTVVRTAKTTGRPTSIAPSTAPSRAARPSSCLRKTFSPITIASSTTIPSTVMKANREIMLMDTSNLGRTKIPAAKEIGMPKVTQKASRRFKKTPSRMLTRIKPMAMFLNSRLMRLFNISERSR